MPERIPLVYTFGNHMHWVDMEWLWGYHVLPGSVRDMLKFCRETGAKGCVNFDGIGYEKLAAENPEALAELRAAIADGQVEPVGCSYGQPYGLFHGGESNIRQRVYGARAVRRILGVWPKTFWEEEFDFFPQLPQILVGSGFTGASLYFQWTWHTPEVPWEASPVIWWAGQDGTKLKCATRNRLNLHQWPEDFQILLDDLASQGPNEVLKKGAPGKDASGNVPPLILQWLELMPSPDWMCRAEIMIPKLKELASDQRFEVRFSTLGEYLAATKDELPTSSYRLDETWHGMSLGKSGDLMRRYSASAEGRLLEMETLSAIVSLFGRPYAQWDVYPIWELEEAWRYLLQAQHHDNDECEALCGRGGLQSYRHSLSITADLEDLQLGCLADRQKKGMVEVAFNTLGWPRSGAIGTDENGLPIIVESCPGFGFTGSNIRRLPNHMRPRRTGQKVHASNISFTIERGLISQITSRLFENGCLKTPLGRVVADFGKKPFEFIVGEEGDSSSPEFSAVLAPLGQKSAPPAFITIEAKIIADVPAVSLRLRTEFIEDVEPDPGLNAGYQMPIQPSFDIRSIFADHSYGVSEVGKGSVGRRKYPTGDWMTSPQWFEEIEGGFTAYSFVDLVDAEGNGLLILHDGSQQWWLSNGGVSVQLGTLDPWDEEDASAAFDANFRIVPHGPMTHSERWRMAQEFRRPMYVMPVGDALPNSFGILTNSSPNVVATALFREEAGYASNYLENYAMPDVSHPFVLRLVEFDGLESEVEIVFAPRVALAIKTNLLGEKLEHGQPSLEDEHRVRLKMRPYEIATLYLDLVEGRKVPRDLDAHREVWATVHR